MHCLYNTRDPYGQPSLGYSQQTVTIIIIIIIIVHIVQQSINFYYVYGVVDIPEVIISVEMLEDLLSSLC